MNKENGYYNNLRLELVRHISKGNNRVLEVGCAEGLLGEYLKKHDLAEEVVGIELTSDAALVAQTRLDRVICGDIETMDYVSVDLKEESFDYIICGDVLEHLRDPWATLTRLETLLKNDGKLIASIPNVRHWSVLLPLLLKGEWTYRPQGIMDRTHLRFFTRKTAVKLIQLSGIKVESCEPIHYRKLDRAISRTTLGWLAGFTAVQWLIAGRKEPKRRLK